MYKLAIMLTVIIIATSQTVQSMDQIQFDPDGNAIQKTDLFTDDLTSGFLLFIKKEVKSHVHMHHSETVYVLAGTANFYLGDKWLKIKTGDIIFIPKRNITRCFGYINNTIKSNFNSVTKVYWQRSDF